MLRRGMVPAKGDVDVQNSLSSSWQLKALAVLIIASGFLYGASSAHADWYYNLVRITCVPGASFAAVETFGLYNIDGRTGLDKEGIRHLADIKDQPVQCELPQGKLLIEVVSYHEPQAQGQCGGIEDAEMRVSLNGAEVARARSTHGGCEYFYQHEIQVTQYSVLHCVLSFNQPPETMEPSDAELVSTKCKNVRIKP